MRLLGQVPQSALPGHQQLHCHLLPCPQRRPVGQQSRSAAHAQAASAAAAGCLSASSSRWQGRARGRRRGGSLVVRADFYDTLGVARGADKKTIKSAYRSQARKFHPDVNKEAGAEQKFKDISNAYEVLSDEQKRGIYDRYGEAGLKGMGGSGGRGSPGVEFNNPFDIFEQFFGGFGGQGGMGGGGMGRQPRQYKGDDKRYDLTLDFTDAVFGVLKTIDPTRLERCEKCDNSGVQAGTTPTTCGACGGAGQVATAMQTPLGMFQQVQTCTRCDGTGESSTPCSTCGGDGRVRRNKSIEVRVPAGIEDGSRLRVRGEGDAGRKGGPSGDLYVYITVRSHPKLTREGAQIHSTIDITYVDAILGSNVKVPTVDGDVDLKIPSGVQPGTTLVMGKRGVPRLGSSGRGDHLVHVRVKIPTTPGKEERELVEQLRELEGKKAKGGIFSKFGL